jgi:hypothetical protein
MRPCRHVRKTAVAQLRQFCEKTMNGYHFGEPASFRFTVPVKTKVPKIQKVEANRTEADLGRLGDIVRKVERAIAAEVFFPNETPLNCSTCPFRQPCREWSRPAEIPSLIPLNVVAAEEQTC